MRPFPLSVSAKIKENVDLGRSFFELLFVYLGLFFPFFSDRQICKPCLGINAYCLPFKEPVTVGMPSYSKHSATI